jgi:hypothetical protein
MRAVAAKNNPGMSPSKPFIAFLAFDDAHFLGVAADSAVVLILPLVLREKFFP